MKKIAVVSIMAMTLATTGCATSGETSMLTGVLSGAACAAMGGSTLECAAAVAVGAAAGYAIHEMIDERDRKTYERAMAEAAASNKSVTMVSPETGNTITFEPTSEVVSGDKDYDFLNDSGQECKYLDGTYVKDGESKSQDDIVICKGSDDIWAPVL